jgi:hypothetical protein
MYLNLDKAYTLQSIKIGYRAKRALLALLAPLAAQLILPSPGVNIVNILS